jgi:hypothetical protein
MQEFLSFFITENPIKLLLLLYIWGNRVWSWYYCLKALDNYHSRREKNHFAGKKGFVG